MKSVWQKKLTEILANINPEKKFLDLRELQIKKIQNTKEIFLAPIFKIKKKAAIGIHKAKYLFYLFKGPKIALGGINARDHV